MYCTPDLVIATILSSFFYGEYSSVTAIPVLQLCCVAGHNFSFVLLLHPSALAAAAPSAERSACDEVEAVLVHRRGSRSASRR